ncbi:AT-rich interactive domain-containing protein 1A-like isoform X2 [Argiope bruennichi]|uniref:AT-rich interactive domain-containing protein 1A-like isoform X2 n=1 Tax=Argiope bruennichi TaxID=94029 RepID=UPI00249427A3|nr:AT-rich interactive domain-containing protein 1A-like isoform X2 [Argiope bruennichi]
MMESPNQSATHQAQLNAQRYGHQLQPGMWGGNKVCANTNGQNANMDPYSQQMNHYYQAQYQSQSNDINRYVSPVSKDQNSNSYSQYPMTRQTNYSCTVPTQNYQVSVKTSCSSNMYYPNVNASKAYPSNNIHSSKKYVNSNLGLPQAHPTVPQSPQVARNTGTPMPQMPHYGDHSNYPMQNMYVTNYNVHNNAENEQSYMLQQTLSSQSSALPTQETLIPSISMVPTNQVSQVSSIPTPPETSSLPGDGLSVIDNTSPDGSADSMKMNISNSFVLPGSVISHVPNNMPSSASSITNPNVMSNRNAGNSLQPPANLDEGSQASSASASSSIPDEQNSMKTNSKPNFSYPPTPNTLSSPGAASMSSFHDDLECISSPGWPKTPASPVANSNYEFANIKRPENLLKLYTLSDEPDRRYFLDKLIVFNEDRGSPITQCPTISKQPLDVFRVYLTVKERGGFVEVTNAKRWKDIAGAIGVGASSSAAYTLRKQYMKLLLPFECKFDRGGIDPQPIINMVEASSRKKGKNSPANSYGNQTHYSQGYPQPMERYHSGYPASYQHPRYPCNNNAVDYQCTSNAMHYPQTAPNNVPHNSGSGQGQYNQYSQTSASNYRYYQGNNPTGNAGYNNMPNNISDNLCRYGRSATSTPVPQEQGYYSHQYSAPQQGQNIQDIYNSGRGCSMQENLTLPVANQIANDLQQMEQLASYSAVSNTVDTSSLKSDISQLPKSSSDSFGNMNMDVTIVGSVTDSLQDKTCMKTSYSTSCKTITSDSTPIVTKCFTPTTPAPQSYQQSIPENAVSKAPETGFYSDTSSFPNRNQGSYLNHVQNTYPNQKLPYQGDYQNKEQMQSSQYSRYSDAQNESYRGSEGPPSTQTERNRTVASHDSTGSSTPYQYSCTSKPNTYAYAPQQGHNKDSFNNLPYCQQYSNRPQRAWLTEQNQHQYQHVGQRPQLKPPVNTSEGKQLPEPSRSRKSWLSFQNASQIQNKHQNVSAPIPTQNQTFLTTKTQPQPNVTPSAPQTVQPVVKKPFEFPPNSVESIRPVAVKRRRCPAKRLGPIDPWRLMLALKSGLLAESTWALDAIAILLADNNTVVYFNLDHLPGLLNVLVDHYRCFLNKIFDLAKDMELGKASISDQKLSIDQFPLGSSDIFNWESKTKILDTPNFTYKTRCKKKIEIQYDEALFLIDPQRSWDIFEDFEVTSEHWQKGGGDITSHIQTCFAEETKKVKFCRELSNEKAKETNENHDIKDKSKMWKSSLLYKGEPVVVLKKCKLDTSKITTISCSRSDIDAEDSCSIISNSSNIDKKIDFSDKKIEFSDKKIEFSDKKIEFSDKKIDEEKDSSESGDSVIEISDSPEGVNCDSPEGVNCDSPEVVNFDSPEGENCASPEVENCDSPEVENCDSPEGENCDSPEGENCYSPEGENSDYVEVENSDSCDVENSDSVEVENSDSVVEVENDDSVIEIENDDSIMEIENEDSIIEIENKVSIMEIENKNSIESDDSVIEIENKDSSKCSSSISDRDEQESKAEPECNSEKSEITETNENPDAKKESCDEVKENIENPESDKENIPRLRGSLSSRKRFLCEDLEDEAYCFDQPALCVMSDSQEMLSRRCVCVSTILRNLSFVPGNDIIMSKNPGVLVLLGRLLLLHHEHKPAKNAYHKYEKELDGNSTWNESCISLKNEHEWWWSTLNVLRDNTLVILSNISSHLDLSPFPEEVSLPILDGLLHWVVCPSSYAQDPLPSRSPSSVLSPQRLCLETLCKLSVLTSNVDLIIATPPWSRIENLFAFLTKSLSYGQDQILREFAVVLLSNISETDTVAARTIAEQSCCIAYLIAFIEEAEANAFQIASSQGTKKLRDKPELMGTTPGMVQRAANTLKNLALVPENRVLFMRYQPQLLSLVMSQVMDQELSAIIADVLFYCSDDVMGDISSHLPIS